MIVISIIRVSNLIYCYWPGNISQRERVQWRILCKSSGVLDEKTVKSFYLYVEDRVNEKRRRLTYEKKIVMNFFFLHFNILHIIFNPVQIDQTVIIQERKNLIQLCDIRDFRRNDVCGCGGGSTVIRLNPVLQSDGYRRRG